MAIIEDNNILEINDINFNVGASAIDIQQENLSYKFQTLRQNTSVKLPTGNGASIATLTIAIPKEDILKLHRLVIQTRRNPIVFIENKLIRQKLVPHWPSTQNMAFMLNNMNIESVVGNVGLFVLKLQMQWFNYFPYTHNITFRQEWKTQWTKINDNDKSLIDEYLGLENIGYTRKSIFDFIVDTHTKDYHPPSGFKKTFEENFEQFNGFLFDLMPVPNSMEKSFSVQTPKESAIYVRYYNELQKRALSTNFNIDIESLIGSKNYYIDLLSGKESLPNYLNRINESGKIIDEMLSYDYFSLSFKIFKFIELPETLKNGLNVQLNKLLSDLPLASSVIEEDPSVLAAIPEDVMEHVIAAERLTELNPVFRAYAIQVIQKLIAGDNLTGTKYIKGTANQLIISDAARAIDANYGVETSLHKIKNPNSGPDSFALDLNINGGTVGNLLDKIDFGKNPTLENYSDAQKVQLFHLDYGYVVNKYFSSYLLWGGNFQFNGKGYDDNSTSKGGLRISNAGYVFNNFTRQQADFLRITNGLKPEENWQSVVYGSKAIGYDPVHIQYKFNGYSSEAIYNKLQSGWRPSNSNGNYVYNTIMGEYKNSNGFIEPWYKVFDLIGSRKLSENDVLFFKQLQSLYESGWQYYNKDPAVNGILYKTVRIDVPTTSGNMLFNNGFQSADGTDLDLDTVLHRVSVTLKHLISNIPIIGQEFPTQQHLGSLEPQYNYEFLTCDRNNLRDGIGKHTQLLESARIALQQNARNIKSIYDCWMADSDNFLLRFMGTYQDSSLFGSVDKKVVINSSNINTIDRNPGLSAYSLQLEESQAFVGEKLVKVNTTTNNQYKQLYYKIMKKIDLISKLSSITQAEQEILNNTEVSDLNLVLDIFTDISNWNFGAGSVVSNIKDKKELGKQLNIKFFVPDHSKKEFNSLNTEELSKIDTLIFHIGQLQSLFSLILFERDWGGLDIYSDLYGLEYTVIPNAKAFLDVEFSSWSNVSLAMLSFIFGAGTLITVDAATAALTIDASMTAFDKAIGQRAEDVTGSSTLRSIIKMGGGLWGALAAIPAVAMSTLFVFYTVDDIGEIVIPPIYSEILIASYLKDIGLYTGAFELAFSSFLPETAAYLVKDFLSFDTSSFQKEEVYGLSGAAFTYLKYAYYNNNNVERNFSKSLTPIKLTNEYFENNKCSLIKNNLEQILRSVLLDPFLISFFEIEDEVSALYNNVTLDSSQALADLNLPLHPYWKKFNQTSPDFYYYNFHEDGQYANFEYLKQLYVDQIKSNIDGSRKFMEDISKGENPNSNKEDISGGEIFSFFDGAENEPSEDLNEALNNDREFAKKVKTQGYTNPNAVSGKPDTLTFNQGEDTCNFLVSNFDRDSVYLPQTPSKLLESIKTLEAQFGSKNGYANERNEIQRLLPNTDISLSDETILPDSMTHFFNQENLEQIALESMKDIVSQRFTLKGVWPTYKLYLIEEDQQEDFIVKYDDFYHYNAIKDITLVRSREVAGDTAIIVLQNISGLLDGSKRLVIKDTDYLYNNRLPDGTLSSKGQKIEEGRKPSNEDTEKEEPIGSIILRPGSNMQLRMGYGNDPNNLEVKLTGRVVDIQFSENSDLIEITLQSFGVELEQQQKGIQPDSDEKFYLTHKLLGALMFSPELKHFGRFEKSIASQIGEGKDSKVDFKNYQSSLIWGKLTKMYFGHTSSELDKIYAETGLLPIAKRSFTTAIPFAGISTVLSTLGQGISLLGSFQWDIFQLEFSRAKTVVDTLVNSFNEKIAYALLSPQDDNLYPPHPKDYLLRPNWQWALLKEGLILPVYNAKDTSEALKSFGRTLIAAKFNQKLEYFDLEYTVQNSTIFQMFHEMTLRHPGYVYAALPYGREFRYTMFFGVPSQRYWSKPAHPFFIERVNKTRKALSSPLNDEFQNESQSGVVRTFWKSKTIDEFRENLRTFLMSEEEFYLEKGKEAISRGLNVNGDTELLQSLGIHTMTDALLEYYQSLTLRFEPFRRYHLVTSDTDIIANNITVNEYDFANAIACKYYSNFDGKEQEDFALVKIHDSMPDDQIRLKQIDYKNVNTKGMALRYATGELIYQTKQMYGGSLLVRGNSRMKPWDFVYIIDKYNDIAGVIEIEQIVERLSYETGYVTEIKPNAVVFANEVASFPILEGIKSIVGAVYREQTMNTFNFKGNDFFNYLLTNSISTEVVDSLSYLYNVDISSNEISSFVQFDINQTTKLPVTDNLSIGQNIFMSGAWLLGGYFYLNRVSSGQAVIVYPLLKNGIPYTGGIPNARPENLWTIFRGQVSLFLNDITKGSTDFISYWKMLGIESLNALIVDSQKNQLTSEAGDKIR